MGKGESSGCKGAHVQEVSLHDGVTPVAPDEAGGNVHQVRQLGSTEALGLEGDLPQIEVATAGPVLQVDLQTECEGSDNP